MKEIKTNCKEFLSQMKKPEPVQNCLTCRYEPEWVNNKAEECKIILPKYAHDISGFLEVYGNQVYYITVGNNGGALEIRTCKGWKEKER